MENFKNNDANVVLTTMLVDEVENFYLENPTDILPLPLNRSVKVNRINDYSFLKFLFEI